MKLKRILAVALCLVIALSLVSCTGLTTTGTTSGTTSGDGTTTSPWYSILSLVLPFGLLIVVFYFFLLRPQKKQQKEVQQMRDSIGRGDTVVTNGGIVGVVITVKDDMVLLESSGDKTKIQIQKWAISSVLEKSNNE